jgi:Brp/Blh family beta-carotene 15,15'-monooxygenase
MTNDADREARFAHRDAVHGLMFVLVAFVCIVAAPWLNRLSTASQVLLLGGMALFIGIPHGALDLPVARAWLAPRWKGAWWAVFLGGYLMAAAPVAVGWALVPGWTLAFFLLTAVCHFAVSDTEHTGLSTPRRWMEGGARGLAPIAVAAWAWPGEVRIYFGYLAGEGAAAVLTDAAKAAAPAALVLVASAAVLRLRDLRRASPEERPRVVAKIGELVVLPVVFALLQPLLAFTLYWIGLHSMHVLLRAATRGTSDGCSTPWGGLRRVLREALPATAATALLAAAAYAAFFRDASLTMAGTALIFMGLAVLNTPHMVFVVISGSHR